LSCVQGAVILFDAAQGVQAQSFSVFDKAQAMGVKLIPCLTKIDLENSKPLDVTLSIADLFNFDPDQVYQTSARSRVGIKSVSFTIYSLLASDLLRCIINVAIFQLNTAVVRRSVWAG
jgi:translation elongation factor EF-4